MGKNFKGIKDRYCKCIKACRLASYHQLENVNASTTRAVAIDTNFHLKQSDW
jgi:hypothetical protein